VRAIVDESHSVCSESIAEFNENREVVQRQITSILPVLWTAAARCSFPLHSLLWSKPSDLQRLLSPWFGSRLPAPKRQQAAAVQEGMKPSPRLTCRATTPHS
jgi:hypothetical protein